MNLNVEDINELIKNFLWLEHERKVAQQEIDKLNTLIDCKNEEIALLRKLLVANKKIERLDNEK